MKGAFARSAVILAFFLLTGEKCLSVHCIEIVSINDADEQGDSSSAVISLSADGRYVCFMSDARNLVPGDTNGTSDVFVYDRNTDVIERVNVDEFGNQVIGWEESACISENGRYVAYDSNNPNIVSGDVNSSSDVFVYDRETGVVELVTLNNFGLQGNGERPTISADGRFVVFESSSSSFVSPDTNPYDIFAYDRQTDTVERISESSGGVQANGECGYGHISADGSRVAFWSYADNLVAGDTNGVIDVFVRDRLLSTTERVSVNSGGAEGNGQSGGACLSADGRYVAFFSEADNLVPGDTNGVEDVFVHDRQTGETERVSVSNTGVEGNGNSWIGYRLCKGISGDGRYVTFASLSDNLVSGDTNGGGDVFVYDRQTDTIQRRNLNSTGNQATGGIWPAISADGNVVAFSSPASDYIPGYDLGQIQVYAVYDCAASPTPTPVPPEKEGLFVSRNIFNPDAGETVEIRWAVLGTREMFLGVYNTAGELVRKLEGQGVSSVGLTRTTEWNGRNDAGDFVASGVYVIHLKGDRSFSGKVVVVK